MTKNDYGDCVSCGARLTLGPPVLGRCKACAEPFSRSFLEHASTTSSQYDSTCRRLAFQVMQTQAELAAALQQCAKVAALLEAFDETACPEDDEDGMHGDWAPYRALRDYVRAALATPSASTETDAARVAADPQRMREERDHYRELYMGLLDDHDLYRRWLLDRYTGTLAEQNQAELAIQQWVERGCPRMGELLDNAANRTGEP